MSGADIILIGVSVWSILMVVVSIGLGVHVIQQEQRKRRPQQEK